MFCPNCGNQLPDGSAFCGNCGASLQKQQPQYQTPTQQPVYQAPAQPQYQPPVMPPQPIGSISKKEFLATKASAETKKQARLVLITFVITLVLIAASVVGTLTMPFYDIPIMSGMLTVADADSDELVEEMESLYEEAEYRYDVQKNTMDKDERDAAKAVMDGLEALNDSFSILNFTSLVGIVEEHGEGYLDDSDIEDMEEINEIMTVVIGIIVGFFVLPLVFTLIGGLTKSTGLTVTALVFTVLAQLILCGLVWVVVSLVVYIIQANLCSKIHKAYQNYRMGRFTAA